MNKKELVSEVSETTGIKQTTVAAVVDAMAEVIKGAIAYGDVVRISGLFVISTSDKAERVARNPRTGEKVVVAAHRTVSIRPSDELKAVANDGPVCRVL